MEMPYITYIWLCSFAAELIEHACANCSNTRSIAAMPTDNLDDTMSIIFGDDLT